MNKEMTTWFTVYIISYEIGLMKNTAHTGCTKETDREMNRSSNRHNVMMICFIRRHIQAWDLHWDWLTDELF
jgi:hypothetical protein